MAHKYYCSDRMCGATDCHNCYPGNQEGEICDSCDQEYQDCTCEEFEAKEDFDEPDDYYDDDLDDYWADKAADQYERKIFGD